MLSLLTKTNN